MPHEIANQADANTLVHHERIQSVGVTGFD